MESINIDEKEEFKNPNIDGLRIQMLEEQDKKYKSFAVVAGTTASLSALIIAGNLIFGDGTVSLTCLGSTIAMVSYSIGYLHLIKNNTNELNEFKAMLERKTTDSYVKRNLSLTKHCLENYTISKAMNIGAGTGFSLAALTNLYVACTQNNLSIQVSSAISAALAATVAIMDTMYVQRTKQRINQYEKDVEFYEELSEIEDDIKEGKLPEEALTKRLREQISKIGK